MNKKKKIIGVAAVLAICLAIAIPVGRGKFNFDDKFKIAENFKANSSKNDAENGKSGDTNNIDGNIGSDSSKDSVSDGKNQDSNSPNGNNDSGSNINNNETDQNNVGNQNNVGGNSNSGNQNTGGVSGDGSITDFDNTGETIKDNYEVNDADIKIQHINSYSGIFIEDGSDVEVDNVAAIQVKNTSKKALEFAQI